MHEKKLFVLGIVNKIRDARDRACEKIRLAIEKRQVRRNAERAAAETERVGPPMLACAGCEVLAEELCLAGNGDSVCLLCFQAEKEDLAAKQAALRDVPADARKCLVSLTGRGIAETDAFKASINDAANLHWAETAWWRDARGIEHPRAWSALRAGEVVAEVRDDFNSRAKRHAYAVYVMGVRVAACRGWHEARFLAADEIARHEEAVEAASAVADAING